MKKVTKKLSLLEMEQVMTVLTEEEQRMLIGGDSNSFFQAMAMVGQLYNDPTGPDGYRNDFISQYGEHSMDNGLYYANALSFMMTEFNVFDSSGIFSSTPFTLNQSNIVFVNYDPNGRYTDKIIDNIVILTGYDPIKGICTYLDPADRQTKTVSSGKITGSNFIYRVDYKPSN